MYKLILKPELSEFIPANIAKSIYFRLKEFSVFL